MSQPVKTVAKQYGFWEGVIASVVISLSVFFLFHYFYSPTQGSQNPPILIVDYAEIIQDLPVDDEMESDRIMMQVGDAIAKFQEAGFLILDNQSVIAGPSDLYLSKEMLYE